MKLILQREKSSLISTIGELAMNGKFFCYTLEDPVREKKISGVTAIPAGMYQIGISWSLRFKQMMPLLLNVPNFTGVRIHVGNYAKDTDGCILVGESRGDTAVYSSVAAYRRLFAVLNEAKSRGEQITITIKDYNQWMLEESK